MVTNDGVVEKTNFGRVAPKLVTTAKSAASDKKRLSVCQTYHLDVTFLVEIG